MSGMRVRQIGFALTTIIGFLALSVLSPSTEAGTGSIPATGTDPLAVTPSTVAGAYQLSDGAWAVPVRGRSPDWLTPELLLKAASGPVTLPAAIADVPVSGYVGIRPGSEMISPAGCTMNFVFRKSGVSAIGTAGHCVDKVGQPVTLLTVAPGTNNPVIVTIGNVISRSDNGVGSDFALVSIKPELQSWVFPTIAQVGGPCGSYTADGTAPDVNGWNPFVKGENPIEAGESIHHYGHGLGIGTGGTSRAGVATAWTTDAFYWAGAVIFGDSGSAARVGNFQAAGDVTHLIVNLKFAAYNAGTRITKMLSLASGWSLVNSPYCTSIITP